MSLSGHILVGRSVIKFITILIYTLKHVDKHRLQICGSQFGHNHNNAPYFVTKYIGMYGMSGNGHIKLNGLYCL